MFGFAFMAYHRSRSAAFIDELCLLILCFLVAVVLAGPLVEVRHAHGSQCPDGDVVTAAANSLMAAARSGSPAAFHSALEKYSDLDRTAVFALGKYRKLLPESRRREFLSATKIYISHAFNSYRKKFKATEIIIKKCAQGRVDSSMFFTGGRGYKPVIWKTRNRKITDVNIQGIWMSQLLKTNYEKILTENGGNFDDFLQRISI